MKYIYYLIIVLLLLIFTDLQAQSTAWKLKTTLPTRRGATSAEVVGGKIYVIGGNKGYPAYPDANTVEAYDPTTNIWDTTKTNMPTPRGWLATATVNDTIYAIGGGYINSNRSVVEAYDPVSDKWTVKKNLPGVKSAIQAVVVDGIIYVIGGVIDGIHSEQCLAFDPSLNQWFLKTDRPEIGGIIALTVYNGLIYTFGGNESLGLPIYKSVYCYDPKTDNWTKKKDMITPRFALRTYLVNGKIYAIGGFIGGSDISSAQVEVYDPVTDTWEVKNSMPNKYAYFAGAVANNKIYVIGGTPDNATSDGAVWEYDPSISETDVDQNFSSPTEFVLNQNYPNPFNPSTIISYQLPVSGRVLLKVYDILGNKIATLVNEEKPAGKYEVEFNGDKFSSGVYFYSLQSGNYSSAKKMILLR